VVAVLELVILGLLAEGDRHGYELRRRLEERTAGLVAPSWGSLYPALARLEAAGAVESTRALPAARRRPTLGVIPATGSLGGELRAWSRRAEDDRGSGPADRRQRRVFRITEAGRTLFSRLLEGAEGPSDEDDRAFAARLAFAAYLDADGRRRLLERRRLHLQARRARIGALGAEGLVGSWLTERLESELSWLETESERLQPIA